jgi:hypothetical protein
LRAGRAQDSDKRHSKRKRPPTEAALLVIHNSIDNELGQVDHKLS